MKKSLMECQAQNLKNYSLLEGELCFWRSSKS